MKPYILLVLVPVAAGSAVMLMAGKSRLPQPIPVMAHWPNPMLISPNGRYLVTTSGDAISLYDFKTHRTRTLTTTGANQFYRYGMGCAAYAFSPNSMVVADGGAALGSSSNINTWNTATGAHIKTFNGGMAGHSILFTPDGKEIIAAGADNSIHIWNASTGRPIKKISGPGGMIVSLALSRQGRRLAIGTIVPTRLVQVRDLPSGHVIWTKKAVPPEAEVPSLAFSPNGATLACGGQYNNIYLYNAHTGAVRAKLSDPVPAALQTYAGSGAANVIAYSPNGEYLAGGGDFRVVVWSAHTDRVVLRPLHSGRPFAFMSNSRAIAATLNDIPAPHLPGSLSYLMHPARRDGNVCLWALH